MGRTTNSHAETNSTVLKKKTRFQLLLPQIIACSIKNYTIFVAGVSTQFPTIIIPALSSVTSFDKEPEILHITSEESSWFGSLTPICQLIGSILAGYVVDAFGRKRILLVTTFPPVIAFVMFYYSKSVWTVFVAYSFIGINNGILQIAAVTYTGEICQADIRAIMVCTATVAYTAGNLVLYTLGSITNWRLVSLICSVFPISAFLIVLRTPETPIWLLSRKQDKEAMKSLQWLRGGVSEAELEHEFKVMKSSLAKDNTSVDQQTTRDMPLRLKLKSFMLRSNLIPFFIANLLFTICMSNGFIAMTPFLVQIFKALGTNLQANWSAVVVAGVSLIATIGCATSVKFLGKRKICLMGLVMCAISTGSLGIYALRELPPNWNSFELQPDVEVKSSWIPLVCMVGLFFFTNLSIADVPWMYMAELFPFRTRGISTGLTMTIALLIGFVNTKVYKDLELEFSIGGAMLCFSAISIIFIPLLYLFLPETEGISLEDIETFFTHKNHKITKVDIKAFLEENGIVQQVINSKSGSSNSKF